MADQTITPPAGYTLDQTIMPPAGYTLDPQSTPAPMTAGGFAKNAMSSAGHLMGGIWTSVRHPVATVKNVADTAAGGINEALGVGDGSTENAKFDAVAKSIKDRYGSLDALGRTLYSDPVGVLADLSVFAGGAAGIAGRIADISDVARLGEVADAARAVSKAGDIAANATSPVRYATQPVAAAFDAAKEPLAESLYGSALKPRKTLSVADTRQAVQTGLENGIVPASRASYEKMNGLIADLKSKINMGIDSKMQDPATPAIDPNDVAARVEDMRPQFQTVNPSGNMRDIDRAKTDFLAQFQQPAPAASGLLDANGNPIPAPPQPPPSQLTLAQAQAMKTRTNTTLAGEMGNQSEATVEAQKGLVRGLKEEIQSIFPEIGPMDEKLGNLLDLQPSVDAAMKRAASSDIIPSATGDVSGILKKIFDRPQIKAHIAIALENTPQFAARAGFNVGQRLALVDARMKNYLDSISGAEARAQSALPAPAASQ